MYEQLLETLKQNKNNYIEAQKAAFKEGTRQFFDNVPDVQAVFWRQYVPYFNDGDACTFSVWDVSPLLAGENFEEAQETDGCFWWGRSIEIPDHVTKAVGKLQSLFNEIEDVLEHSFGSHAQVVMYRDGRVDVEEYEDHD